MASGKLAIKCSGAEERFVNFSNLPEAKGNLVANFPTSHGISKSTLRYKFMFFVLHGNEGSLVNKEISCVLLNFRRKFPNFPVKFSRLKGYACVMMEIEGLHPLWEQKNSR